MAQTRTLERFNEQQREQIKDALRDGLAGRRAVMRAYENLSDRIEDSETKSMLRRFHEEEKQEHEKASQICDRYDVDIRAVENIKAEVAAFLGKVLVSGAKGPYSDLRDLTILYGVEASGRVAAGAILDVAKTVRDDDWVSSIEASRERSHTHMDYLEGRINELSRTAFGTGR